MTSKQEQKNSSKSSGNVRKKGIVKARGRKAPVKKASNKTSTTSTKRPKTIKVPRSLKCLIPIEMSTTSPRGGNRRSPLSSTIVYSNAAISPDKKIVSLTGKRRWVRKGSPETLAFPSSPPTTKKRKISGKAVVKDTTSSDGEDTQKMEDGENKKQLAQKPTRKGTKTKNSTQAKQQSVHEKKKTKKQKTSQPLDKAKKTTKKKISPTNSKKKTFAASTTESTAKKSAKKKTKKEATKTTKKSPNKKVAKKRGPYKKTSKTEAKSSASTQRKSKSKDNASGKHSNDLITRSKKSKTYIPATRVSTRKRKRTKKFDPEENEKKRSPKKKPQTPPAVIGIFDTTVPPKKKRRKMKIVGIVEPQDEVVITSRPQISKRNSSKKSSKTSAKPNAKIKAKVLAKVLNPSTTNVIPGIVVPSSRKAINVEKKDGSSDVVEHKHDNEIVSEKKRNDEREGKHNTRFNACLSGDNTPKKIVATAAQNNQKIETGELYDPENSRKSSIAKYNVQYPSITTRTNPVVLITPPRPPAMMVQDDSSAAKEEDRVQERKKKKTNSASSRHGPVPRLEQSTPEQLKAKRAKLHMKQKRGIDLENISQISAAQNLFPSTTKTKIVALQKELQTQKQQKSSADEKQQNESSKTSPEISEKSEMTKKRDDKKTNISSNFEANSKKAEMKIESQSVQEKNNIALGSSDSTNSTKKKPDIIVLDDSSLEAESESHEGNNFIDAHKDHNSTSSPSCSGVTSISPGGPGVVPHPPSNSSVSSPSSSTSSSSLSSSSSYVSSSSSSSSKIKANHQQHSSFPSPQSSSAVIHSSVSRASSSSSSSPQSSSSLTRLEQYIKPAAVELEPVSKNPLDWTHDHVRIWIRSMGGYYTAYANVFHQRRVTGKDMLALNESDISQYMGKQNKLGKTRALMNKIHDFRRTFMPGLARISSFETRNVKKYSHHQTSSSHNSKPRSQKSSSSSFSSSSRGRHFRGFVRQNMHNNYSTTRSSSSSSSSLRKPKRMNEESPIRRSSRRYRKVPARFLENLTSSEDQISSEDSYESPSSSDDDTFSKPTAAASTIKNIIESQTSSVPRRTAASGSPNISLDNLESVGSINGADRLLLPPSHNWHYKQQNQQIAYMIHQQNGVNPSESPPPPPPPTAPPPQNIIQRPSPSTSSSSLTTTAYITQSHHHHHTTQTSHLQTPQGSLFSQPSIWGRKQPSNAAAKCVLDTPLSFVPPNFNMSPPQKQKISNSNKSSMHNNVVTTTASTASTASTATASTLLQPAHTKILSQMKISSSKMNVQKILGDNIRTKQVLPMTTSPKTDDGIHEVMKQMDTDPDFVPHGGFSG